MKLAGKVAVITGAASGIGRELARRFVQEGATVVASDLNAEQGEKAAREVGARFVGCNVAHEDEVAALVRNVLDTEGRIDLFFSNAGLAIGGGEDTPDRHWDLSWRVNTLSHVFAARAVLPHMLERGDGYLLSTASAAGLLTEIHTAPYAVTKHAAVAFAEWLAVTYGSRGIRVSCLCPEYVQTPMIQNTGDDWGAIQSRAIPVEAVGDAVVQAIDEERFLILTHPTTLPAFQARALDHEKWLGRMRGYRDKAMGQESGS